MRAENSFSTLILDNKKKLLTTAVPLHFMSISRLKYILYRASHQFTNNPLTMSCIQNKYDYTYKSHKCSGRESTKLFTYTYTYALYKTLANSVIIIEL